MKNKLFLILAAVLLCSCTSKIEQEIINQVTTENKTAYIDGFNVHNTYTKDCYVRFVMDGSGLNIRTSYSSKVLTNDILPYYFMLNTPVRVGSFKDYSSFNFTMYVAKKTSLDGAPIIDTTIKAADLDGKTRYTVTDPNNGAKVEIVISYK